MDLHAISWKIGMNKAESKKSTKSIAFQVNKRVLRTYQEIGTNEAGIRGSTESIRKRRNDRYTNINLYRNINWKLFDYL